MRLVLREENRLRRKPSAYTEFLRDNAHNVRGVQSNRLRFRILTKLWREHKARKRQQSEATVDNR